MSKAPQQEKARLKGLDGLVLIVSFELIMSFDECRKFKSRGDMTEASLMKKGKGDL